MSYPADHSDAWLDAQLRAVHLPDGLDERLRQIAATSVGDAELDARLRDVPVPAGVLERLRAIAAPRRVRWARLALAASLMLALGSVYLAAAGSLVWSVYEPPLSQHSRAVLVASVLDEVEALRWSWVRPVEIDAEPGAMGPAAGPPFASQDHDPSDLKSAMLDEPSRGLPDLFRPAAAGAVWTPRPRWSEEFALAELRLSSLLAQSAAPAAAPELPATWTVLHEPWDARAAAGPRPRGFDLPLDHFAQRFFLLKYGIYPPLSPKDRPSSPVPLVHSTASFELWREALGKGELPPPEMVRTEEFLTATDLGGQRGARASINLSAVVGPSPLGDRSGHLLRIGVEAREFPTGARRPVHLTLAVDVSPNMRLAGRLEMVKRAIAGLARELGPADRLDLVELHGRAEPLVEAVRRGEERWWEAAVGALRVRQEATDLAGGLLTALAVVEEGPVPRGQVRRLVLIGDGAAEWQASSRELLGRTVQQAAAGGVSISLLHLSPLGAPDPRLVEMVSASQGQTWHAWSEAPIRWALRETLSGRRQVAAQDARLSVTFNPKAVSSYRLLGHEPVAVAGLMPVRVEADLHAGQSAAAVFEISLVPPAAPAAGQAAPGAAPADVELASVQLAWSDPKDGTPRQAGQRVLHSQVRTSLEECPPALQMAALAACAAEVLRNSPFADDLTLADVLAFSRGLRGPLVLEPAFRDFVSLLEKAEPIELRRRGRREGRPR